MKSFEWKFWMPLSSKNGDGHTKVIIDRMNRFGKSNSNDDIYRSKNKSTPSKLPTELSRLLTIETAGQIASHVQTRLIRGGRSLQQQLRKRLTKTLSLKTF